MSRVNVLMSIVMNLNVKDQSFAKSLIQQAQVRHLSDKQIYWVEKLIERGTKPVETVSVSVSCKSIVDLIRRNNNAKRPKINVLVDGVEYRLSVAGSKARVPGSINVVSGQTWYGRILETGEFEYKNVSGDQLTKIVTALNYIGTNPEAAALEYAKQTGRCCFCSLHLEDKRSLEVGYGPICAKKYRLPWNASALTKELLVKTLTNEEAFG